MTHKTSRPLVLVADDDESWRELVPRWIQSNGWDAAVVGRGADVIPAALQRRPDCIVLDHELGTMAGEMLKIMHGGRPDHFVVKSGRPEDLLAVLETFLPGPDAPPVSFKH